VSQSTLNNIFDNSTILGQTKPNSLKAQDLKQNFVNGRNIPKLFAN